MKSRLAIITALVTIATGSPVKAEDTQLGYRAHVVGAMASAECFVRNKGFTQEQVDDLLKDYINNHPQLKLAYSWATRSPKAKEALQVLRPYMASDCDDINLSDEEAGKLIHPYLE